MFNAPGTFFGEAALTTRAAVSRQREHRLAFFNVKTAEVQPDRRVARRYIVDCPARLKLSGGGRDGRLTDLSEHGARFETAAPPAAGTTGFLRWEGEEHYCTVIWTADGRCGLKFDRPIQTGLVEKTCSHVEVTLKPVATVGRIPLGQRRSGRVATVD